ncbi:MAG: helix-turn-helix transcriptional regulator [Clostridia bacterium]|nr:helix-turn-helix transcriptional regulator [Clostridia bacterium]
MVLNCQKIKARMVELGTNQGEVAEKMGIDRGTLNAKVNDPTGSRLTLDDIYSLIGILKIDDPRPYFFCG